MKDYYKILGIERDATTNQIKRAYRKMAIKYHPDMNRDPNANWFIRDINEAYQTLGNQHNKRKYDLNLLSGGYTIDPKYNEGKGRKYGTAYKYKSRAKTPPPPTSYKKPDRDFEIMQNGAYYSLLVIGILGIIFAITDLFQNKVEDLNSLSGIIFGVLFTSLLIYTRLKIYTKKK